MVENVPPNASAAADSQSVEQRSAAIIQELITLDNSYFGKDRIKVIRAKLDEGVALLDSKPIDLGKCKTIISLSLFTVT